MILLQKLEIPVCTVSGVRQESNPMEGPSLTLTVQSQVTSRAPALQGV